MKGSADCWRKKVRCETMFEDVPHTRKPSLEVVPTTLATISQSWVFGWLNQRAKYLGQRSLCSKVIVWTQTQSTDCSTWTTKVHGRQKSEVVCVSTKETRRLRPTSWDVKTAYHRAGASYLQLCLRTLAKLRRQSSRNVVGLHRFKGRMNILNKLNWLYFGAPRIRQRHDSTAYTDVGRGI